MTLNGDEVRLLNCFGRVRYFRPLPARKRPSLPSQLEIPMAPPASAAGKTLLVRFLVVYRYWQKVSGGSDAGKSPKRQR